MDRERRGACAMWSELNRKSRGERRGCRRLSHASSAPGAIYIAFFLARK